VTARGSDQETSARPGVELRFPAGFAWGAATAAYQVEGAASADGRGPSIWDTFSHAPGNVLGGDTGDVAVDHYHRFRDDVALMADLGITAYRFSVSWPRVQPAGAGPANRAGLDFYRRLVDALLEAGIVPYPTLYHWDLPQALEDAGGWPARDVAGRFADYAELVGRALGDRTHHWTTVNEPWCAAFLGYASGAHAPGRREPAASVRAAHHLLLAHGLATQALHAQHPDHRVGVAVNLYAVSPASDAAADIDAARRIDGLQNRLFLDALFRACYPEDVVADLAVHGDFGFVRDGDLAVVATPVDVLGVNYYSRHTVSGLPGGSGVDGTSALPSASPWPGSEHVRFVSAGRPVTAMGWEIDEGGLVEVLRRVSERYAAVPLLVTENGAAFADELAGGAVHDRDRARYLDAHLRACHAAIAAGVPLRGYFAWSLMDNFEWTWGYSQRFGLVHVDFASQRRTPKDSALWYAEVIRRGGLPLRDEDTGTPPRDGSRGGSW
jgi:beta-glucosidase